MPITTVSLGDQIRTLVTCLAAFTQLKPKLNLPEPKYWQIYLAKTKYEAYTDNVVTILAELKGKSCWHYFNCIIIYPQWSKKKNTAVCQVLKSQHRLVRSSRHKGSYCKWLCCSSRCSATTRLEMSSESGRTTCLKGLSHKKYCLELNTASSYEHFLYSYHI